MIEKRALESIKVDGREYRVDGSSWKSIESIEPIGLPSDFEAFKTFFDTVLGEAYILEDEEEDK